VQSTLEEINAAQIPCLTVLNKVDQLPKPDLAQEVASQYENAVAISARTGSGIPQLLQSIEQQLFENFTPIQVRLPYQQGQLISLFHEQGQVQKIEHIRGGVGMVGMIPGRLITRYQPYFASQKPVDSELEEDHDA
jgi:GTP-binding protein HflX